MAEDTSLQELILGYCRQVGGLVEPPAYGIHEVLLPDEVATLWGVDAHQRFVFDSESGAAEGYATLLHYGHPLVETIVDELRQQSANGLFLINNVHLEKPGLYAAIEKSLLVTNSRLFPVPGAMERRRLYHYVRFNFKASLVADEKRELILPVWMHLQGGYVVKADEIERLAILDNENQFRHLVPAAPSWVEGGPLTQEVLRLLLERASQAALEQLAPILEGLRHRLQRYLELDQARLKQYYDDLTKDVERRLKKAVDDDRRPALETKFAAIASERQAKLVDIEQKYSLRVDLELVNMAVIAQPKLDLTIEIKKRTASVQRQVVWDPLLHRVEPLTCDVCGQPSYNLSLCEDGHLAHTGCLAPQCVECKRTYCQKCAGQVETCVVCDRPVCGHSLVRCPTCKRVSCHDHVGLCHVENGEPRRLTAEGKPAATQPSLAPAASPAEAKSSSNQKPIAKADPSKGRASSTRPVSVKEKTHIPVTGDYLEVYSDPAQGIVTAYVMVRRREIAARTWEMTEEGIAVYCHCEKGLECQQNHLVYLPAPDSQLETQLLRFINTLRDEYGVPEKKIRFYHVRQGQAYEERKLKLPGSWRDPEALARAREGFDRLAAKRSRR